MEYIVLAVFLLAFLYSVILHEIAHGWVAKQAGDYTAEAAGRLSLNPVRHIDPFMTILMPIMTYMFAGIIFGGAKPVPVNPYNFRHLEMDDLKVSLAGVTTNFVIALVFGFGTHLWAPTSYNFMLFGMISIVNLALGVFNLIPIPPLDGSHVMRFVLGRIDPGLAGAYERIGIFGFILIIFLVRYLWSPIGYAVSFVWDRVMFIDVPWYIVLDRFRSMF